MTTKYNGITRILHNIVHVSKAFDPTTQPKPLNPQTCGAREFEAIWDTGATGTVISQKVADECGLKPISIAEVSTANGKRLSSVYLASVFLPSLVIFPQLRVTEGSILGADVLIGMDIITRGDFAVTNVNGQTTFSFQWPSSQTIDFVKSTDSSNALKTQKFLPKIGGNDPCPCGSGKKYKKVPRTVIDHIPKHCAFLQKTSINDMLTMFSL